MCSALMTNNFFIRTCPELFLSSLEYYCKKIIKRSALKTCEQYIHEKVQQRVIKPGLVYLGLLRIKINNFEKGNIVPYEIMIEIELSSKKNLLEQLHNRISLL